MGAFRKFGSFLGLVETEEDLYEEEYLEPMPEPVRQDRKSTRLNSSHSQQSRMPSSA